MTYKLFLGNSPTGPAAYELDCQPGAFALTGPAVGLLASRLIDAQPGAIVLAGAAAGLSLGRFINAQAGTVVLTGAAADVLAGRAINAQAGALALTGAAAQLPRGLYLSADPATFAVSGADAALLRGIALDAQPGALALTGAGADLIHEIVGQYELNADPGAFAVAGAAAGLLAGRVLDAQPGALALAGADAEAAFARMLDAQAGSFVIHGQPAAADLNGVPVGAVPAEEAEEEFTRGGGAWKRPGRRWLSRVLRPFDELFVETGGLLVARRVASKPTPVSASLARIGAFEGAAEEHLELAASSSWRSAVLHRSYDEARESAGLTARRGMPSREALAWFLENVA